MIVAFDNTILTLVFNPDAKPCIDPNTRQPVDYIKQRVNSLIDHHSSAGDTILLPTPALSETYSCVDDPSKLAQAISEYHCFRPAPFDNKAALELAKVIQSAIKSGDKRSGSSEPYQKIKFDRQIVAISKAHNAETLYTDDVTQTLFAESLGITVVHSWELEMSAKHAQVNMLEDND